MKSEKGSELSKVAEGESKRDQNSVNSSECRVVLSRRSRKTIDVCV